MFTRLIGTMVERFNMLWFIMALGLGGTSIAGFAVLNYTFERPEGAKGLVHPDMIDANLDAQASGWATIYHWLSAHIPVFATLHLVAILGVFAFFVAWRRKFPEKYRALLADNTRNAVIITPALALGMTFNVFLVGGYFLFPEVRSNMQALMPYALGGWLALFAYTMITAIRIQVRHLETGFDVLKMHFGWLLVPFALAMTAVSGAGVAALSKDPMVAKVAFMLSLVPFSMAAFLLVVKLLSIFRSQYRLGLPERVEFLPTFFIIIPIMTLLAITMFRYGHFFEHVSGDHLPQAFFGLVTGGAWAFEWWYAALGLVLVGFYFKRHLFNREYFDESQWGLICPMVAMAVLGAFVYKNLLPSPVVFWILVGLLILDVAVITWIGTRQVSALWERAKEHHVGEPAVAAAK